MTLQEGIIIKCFSHAWLLFSKDGPLIWHVSTSFVVKLKTSKCCFRKHIRSHASSNRVKWDLISLAINLVSSFFVYYTTWLVHFISKRQWLQSFRARVKWTYPLNYSVLERTTMFQLISQATEFSPSFPKMTLQILFVPPSFHKWDYTLSHIVSNCCCWGSRRLRSNVQAKRRLL